VKDFDAASNTYTAGEPSGVQREVVGGDLVAEEDAGQSATESLPTVASGCFRSSPVGGQEAIWRGNKCPLIVVGSVAVGYSSCKLLF
jgi:hypothetical protein